jgi:hypothetical protein
MSEESSSVILDFKKPNIQALVAALATPEFCWPINDLWIVQVCALDEYYCGDCYLNELYSFVSISQRKTFAHYSEMREGSYENIYCDEIINILEGLEDDDFCCRCERWAVIVCSNFESGYDGSNVTDYVKHIQEHIDVHQGTISAEP